jgi:hypothetical protein
MAKRPRDSNQLATLITQIASGEANDTISPAKKRKPKGRIGGLKGGKSRAAILTPEQRHDIAKLAARARWKKKD